MSDFITELRERRVLPAVGVYAAGCWVLIEIIDRLVERYLLSPYLTDLVFWGLYSLIPAVVLVAWSYGRPGKDSATAAQKVGVPINVIATLGLLFTLFGDKDLGAAASLVTVANEEGQTETHYVPSESYRRRMAVFFFDHTGGDGARDWLQYGITELLVQDLQQDPFVLATSPWANWGNGFYLRMRQAGFEDGLDVPRSLMREIAEDANRQYFVDGEFATQGDEYRVTARIWNTRSLELVGEVSESGWDLYPVIDSVSRGIRDALDVPSGERIARDMPLSETYGESGEAFRQYIEGLNVRLFSNDVPGAIARFDESLRADPEFVLAWYAKGTQLYEGGDMPAAQAAFARAQDLAYRLPERDRALLKQINYRLAGENDKLIAFQRLQTQLSGDASSHYRLATTLLLGGRIEEAKGEFLASLEKDPLNVGVYLNLSMIERAMGDAQAAIEYAKRYQREKPQDEEAHLVLGDLLRDSGNLEGANEQYIRAQLLADSPVVPLLRLADLAARNGDTGSARMLLEQADEAARAPLERTLVRQGAAYLEQRLGRLGASIEQIHAQAEQAALALPPLAVAISTYVPLVQSYLELGDVENAERALQAGKAMLQPPLDEFLSFSEAQIHIHRGELDAARESIDRAESMTRQFGVDALLFQVDHLKGEISAEAGDYDAAVELHASALQRVERAAFGGQMGLAVPLLYAKLAEHQINAGLIQEAERSITAGMKLDPNQPLLWLQRARQQNAAGMEPLASASLQYALAVWKDADPAYECLIEAQALSREIGGSGG